MPAKKKSASSADAPKRRKTKKAAAKKVSAKRIVKKPASKAAKPKEKLLGKVDHYFDKISVAAMKLGDTLKVGDMVRIEGGSVVFTQQIASVQIDHEPVSTAKKGDEVGFKVKQKVREGYRVYRVA